MRYHCCKTFAGLSALALAVSAVYAAPTGPISRTHEETTGETSGPFFNAELFTLVQGECDGVCEVGVCQCPEGESQPCPPCDETKCNPRAGTCTNPGKLGAACRQDSHCNICTGGKLGSSCTTDAACNWKCIAGRVGDACGTDADCNVYNNIIQTGFEAADGWDLGHSICGDEFALGLTCNYPVTNICITKNHAASQNCCPEDPNEVNGWSMSPSSRHCLYPLVTDVHPSQLKAEDPKFGQSTQHLRFAYDPDGGNPAGCNGFAPACRQRYITSQGSVPQVSHSIWKKDIAWSGTLGSSVVDVHGQDTHAGSIDLTTYLYWHYYGGLYIYDFIASTFVFGGYWSATVPEYCQFVIDLNPCDNTATYSYCGAVVHTEDYGFTPPYGDRASNGGDDPRPPTTDTSFFTTDHYPPVKIDIDNFDVKNTPCGEACCDQDTGICTDVAKGECPSKVVYPNTLCSQLGSPGYPPVCAIATGSCCDTSPMAGGKDPAGVCTNGVLESACGGPQQVWVKGGSCTDVGGVCHIGHGNCGGATGCDNFPYVGQKCATDEDCAVPGFCYPGYCTVTLTGTCEYSSAGWCASGGNEMGRCSGSATCTPSTGDGCCDPGCPVDCPEGETCLPEKQPCDAVPQGFDCAFCEGCTAWPAVLCNSVVDCPSPAPGVTAVACNPNPLFGCYSSADCATGETCIINKGGKAGQLCATDAECSIEASACVEVPGACCETVKGTCEDGVYAGDCQGAQREWSKGTTCEEAGCDPTLGACCDRDTFGRCTDTTFNGCPTDGNKNVWTKGILCEQLDPACTHEAIPTVSEWGLVVLTLLLLTGAKVYFGRRQAAAA